VKPVKQTTNVRMIVQTDDRAALNCAQLRRDFSYSANGNATPYPSVSYRRIQVEQRVRPIVAIDARGPVQPLDECVREPQMRR
jgi:hypothetical protein